MNSTLFCKQLNDLDFQQAANPAAAELVSSMQYSRAKKFSVFLFQAPKAGRPHLQHMGLFKGWIAMEKLIEIQETELE